MLVACSRLVRCRVYWEGVPGVGGVLPGVQCLVLPGPNPWVFPVRYCQGPTHGFPGSHIRVSRVPYTGIQGPIYRFPYVQCHGTHMYSATGPICTVPNSAKLVILRSKQCQTSHIEVKTVSKQHVLRCTRGITRPFDWEYEVYGGLETCIPTAWSMETCTQTVINDPQEYG